MLAACCVLLPKRLTVLDLGTLHETGGSRSLTFKSDVAEMKKLLETLSEGGSV